MKKIWIGLILFLALSGTTYAESDSEKIKESIYKIRCTDMNSQGSGFIIEDTLITNYHVAGECETFEVIQGEEITELTQDDVLFANEDTDVMGIRFDGESLSYSTKLPSYSEKVYTMGFPKNEFAESEGNVKFIIKKYGMKIIITDAKVDSGSSGGVMYNKNGEVVGITARKLKTFSEVVPISYAISEIEQLRGE